MKDDRPVVDSTACSLVRLSRILRSVSKLRSACNDMSGFIIIVIFGRRGLEVGRLVDVESSKHRESYCSIHSIMGKRSSSEIEEEEVVDTEKKSKKEKKDKKDKKRSRDEPEPEPEVVEQVPEVNEDAAVSTTTDRKKISEDDFESKKVLFGKWLKDEKDM